MTVVLTDDIRNWIAFLRMYASSRVHAIQPALKDSPALVLLNGPKTPLGHATLAVELDAVLCQPRETVRAEIARKLKQARRDFRRRM